jgi:hypothetical protein
MKVRPDVNGIMHKIFNTDRECKFSQPFFLKLFKHIKNQILNSSLWIFTHFIVYLLDLADMVCVALCAHFRHNMSPKANCKIIHTINKHTSQRFVERTERYCQNECQENYSENETN